MTSPLIRTPPYSMKIFALETFTNCTKTTKLAKVFSRKKFRYTVVTDGRKEHTQTHTFLGGVKCFQELITKIPN